MSLGLYRVRRATVDDLPSLQKLWASMHFVSADLERRITEFQVIENDEGILLGILALEVNGRQGRLHSEAFADFALADHLREQLWARMQSVAENFGLARLWTSEAAPFWKRTGLQPATSDALRKLPESWGVSQCDWLTLQLRDEAALQATLDAKFASFQEEERRRREEVLQKARTWKFIAVGLVLVIIIACIFLSIYLLQHRQALLHRGS